MKKRGHFVYPQCIATEKAKKFSTFLTVAKCLGPLAGLEPARYRYRGILSVIFYLLSFFVIARKPHY